MESGLLQITFSASLSSQTLGPFWAKINAVLNCHPDFNATCYIWVSSANAHTKLPQVIQEEHKALVDSLINGSSQTYPAELTATGSILHISPEMVYTININDTDAPNCLSPKEPCVVLEEFVPRQDCSFGLICPVLEGNICGSYGITLSNTEGNTQGERPFQRLRTVC